MAQGFITLTFSKRLSQDGNQRWSILKPRPCLSPGAWVLWKAGQCRAGSCVVLIQALRPAANWLRGGQLTFLGLDAHLENAGRWDWRESLRDVLQLYWSVLLFTEDCPSPCSLCSEPLLLPFFLLLQACASGWPGLLQILSSSMESGRTMRSFHSAPSPFPASCRVDLVSFDLLPAFL